MRRQSCLARLLASSTVTAMLAIGLGGCQTAAMSDVTGSLGAKAETKSEKHSGTDPQRTVEVYGERFRANPKDADAALKYGLALRAIGQRAQAVAVRERAAILNPGNKAVLAGWGRALADNGQSQQAFDVLSRAHTPANPDWRILSVQGTTLDKLGRHEDARRYYASALRIMPDEPSVLSNLGMSYVLTRELPKAEETLRRAHDGAPVDSRIRQNLALAVGLQGRFDEAENIVKADLPVDEAAANVAYLKQMLGRGANARVGAADNVRQSSRRSRSES
ncbi:MAG TPA: tetratricopeptide repeat protein [Nitrobacter sp.]|uniref:tetratricopeptide repeat protein n=1 Tax=Nitrobacter sp. TaxID=29420 RepID=UPI002CDB047B|nr:tetratricopeptide repeat protein [Nitrobacter sp.]